VDFTVEVERALKVLDGAILVLCAVGGVQSQSLTVDRQMKRYKVPRLAFINKCDRMGANPEKVAKQLHEQLGLNSVLLQLPIGLEDNFKGVIDLITMKAMYFDGPTGEIIREEEIPEQMVSQALKKREEMLDKISMACDDLTEAILEDRVTETLVYTALRNGTIKLSLVPVLIGSAYKNKGIQPLLDAVASYLPSPEDVTNVALDNDHNEAEVALRAVADAPVVANAFKLEDGRYGQLTYIRIYQGTILKGTELTNTRTHKDIRVGRLVRMHASAMEEINKAQAGDIVALFGIDCASGDTFTSGNLNYSLSSMFVPKPVISISVKTKDKQANDVLSKALNRFCKEDPTFRSFIDEESSQTIIEGMGELHLDVYLTRIKREYGIDVETGKPQVAYRETISQKADYNYTHKKQTGGAGQFARVQGYIEPSESGDYEFVNELKGGVIPKEYVPAVDKGFQECFKKGGLIGFPITGVKAVLFDGSTHSVDSSDMAFRQAAIGAFREVYFKSKPLILEPVMKVSIEGPGEFQGAILGSINQRRGMIVGVTDNGSFIRVDSLVPLAEMFGYSTSLRSATQGKAEFSMEFHKYEKVPNAIAELLIKENKEKEKKS
jgi:elongation factor G